MSFSAILGKELSGGLESVVGYDGTFLALKSDGEMLMWGRYASKQKTTRGVDHIEVVGQHIVHGCKVRGEQLNYCLNNGPFSLAERSAIESATGFPNGFLSDLNVKIDVRTSIPSDVAMKIHHNTCPAMDTGWSRPLWPVRDLIGLQSEIYSGIHQDTIFDSSRNPSAELRRSGLLTTRNDFTTRCYPQAVAQPVHSRSAGALAMLSERASDSFLRQQFVQAILKVWRRGGEGEA